MYKEVWDAPTPERRSRCVGSTAFDVALLPLHPWRTPHPALRHSSPIRFDVKRERKKRYLARRPEKLARRDALACAIYDWCVQNYLLTCGPVERLFRLLWEEYPYGEEVDGSALPD